MTFLICILCIYCSLEMLIGISGCIFSVISYNKESFFFANNHLIYRLLLVNYLFYVQVLLNEVAPRPHNSGHHTIESCYTSQYEQHLRAVLGLPLGDPSMKVPAAIMYNLLGEDEVPFLFQFASCDLVSLDL